MNLLLNPLKAKRLELTSRLDALSNNMTLLRERLQMLEREMDQVVGGIQAITELIDENSKPDVN
jgi:hypothetical protein